MKTFTPVTPVQDRTDESNIKLFLLGVFAFIFNLVQIFARSSALSSGAQSHEKFGFGFSILLATAMLAWLLSGNLFRGLWSHRNEFGVAFYLIAAWVMTMFSGMIYGQGHQEWVLNKHSMMLAVSFGVFVWLCSLSIMNCGSKTANMVTSTLAVFSLIFGLRVALGWNEASTMRFAAGLSIATAVFSWLGVVYGRQKYTTWLQVKRSEESVENRRREQAFLNPKVSLKVDWMSLFGALISVYGDEYIHVLDENELPDGIASVKDWKKVVNHIQSKGLVLSPADLSKILLRAHQLEQKSLADGDLILQGHPRHSSLVDSSWELTNKILGIKSEYQHTCGEEVEES